MKVASIFSSNSHQVGWEGVFPQSVRRLPDVSTGPVVSRCREEAAWSAARPVRPAQTEGC